MPNPAETIPKETHQYPVPFLKTRRFVALGASVLSLAGGYLAAKAEPAAAENGGYPEAAKPCLSGDPGDPNSSYGKTTGVGYWCKDYRWGDLASGQENSSRGYAYRNCTDWVAYRVPQLTGVKLPTGLGNARNWDDNSPAGFTKDLLPEPGDIAQSDDGYYGHVGVVEKVTRDDAGNITSIEVSEFNKGGDGDYSYNTYSSKNPEGKFVRYGGYDWDNFIDVNGSEVASLPTADLLLAVDKGANGLASVALRSLGSWFSGPELWGSDPDLGWKGVKVMSGNMNTDNRADRILLTDEGVSGSKLVVSLSLGDKLAPRRVYASLWGYGYSGIKPMAGDVNGDGLDDVILTVDKGNAGTGVVVLKTNPGGWSNAPESWAAYPLLGWRGVTPLLGDVNGDKAADYVLLTNEGANGTKAWVALSTKTGFAPLRAWWNGVGYGYGGIKPNLADVNGDKRADLVLTTQEAAGIGSIVLKAEANKEWFANPELWASDPDMAFAGVTPLIADVNGDSMADRVLLVDAGPEGSKVVVSESGRDKFLARQTKLSLWGYAYSGIKAAAGNADGK